MRESRRNFYGRCMDVTALALSIFVFFILMAVAVVPAMAGPSIANATEKSPRAATTLGDAAFVSADLQRDFLSPEKQWSSNRTSVERVKIY